jgi:hypothetical protein
MRRRIMGTVLSFCTKKDCAARATWWLTVRVDGLDVDHARCEEHSR